MLKILLLWLVGGIWGLSNMMLRPRKLSCDRIYYMELKKGKFDEAIYKKAKKKRFMISSDFGYLLSCELLEPDARVASRYQLPIAILCHGFSQGKYKSLIYAEIFLEMGFMVLIYDHRNHGLSGKAHTSMGYYEKYDLKKLVDWCYHTFGSKCKIITHGESMGASTALLHLEIDSRVICTIADCAYSDLKELLRHQVKHYYHMPQLLIPIESFISYLRAGFWYGNVSPIRVVSKVDTPILFIHGKNDKYVPTIMSEKMYKCKKNKKALYLVSGAAHGQSCVVNRKVYKRRVREFVEKHMI